MSKEKFFEKGRYFIEDFGEQMQVNYKPHLHSLTSYLTIKACRADDLRYYFIISLKSQIKPDIKAVRLIDPAHRTLQTPDKVRDCIVLTGLALATHLNERYADGYNPDKVAKVALDTFEDMMKYLGEKHAFVT